MRHRHRATAPIVIIVVTALAAGCNGGQGAAGGGGTTASPGSPASTASPATGTSEPAGGVRDHVTSIDDPAFPDLGDPALDVAHYDLTLTYDPASNHLAGVATLDITTLTAVDAFQLDLKGLKVEKVDLAGDPVGFEVAKRKLVVHAGRPLAKGASFPLTVTYSGEPEGQPTRSLGGIAVGWQTVAGGSFALSEPEGAQTWYPVNEHPTDKAAYDITVTVPADLVAISNGSLVSEEAKGDRRTFHWRMGDPMAPYLATVVTGPYEAKRTEGPHGLPLTVWSVGAAGGGRQRGGGAAGAFAKQADVVSFLEERLGPFPFDSYGGVVLQPHPTEPFFNGVAIETQSLSLYGSQSLIESTVVHETAHQWMGDNVSVTRWADDIWWVEGFARFAEWLWIEHVGGADAYASEVGSARGDAVCAPPTRDLFGSGSYDGGAEVFARLREKMGDDAFFAGLRTFNERYRHANATSADLVEVMGEAAGTDLKAEIDAWRGCKGVGAVHAA